MNVHICCNPESNTFSKIQSLAEIIKVVADANKLRILCLLSKKPHCVCDIQEHFSMSQSLVSHQLSSLLSNQLVTKTKVGRKMEYALTTKGSRIASTLLTLEVYVHY